MEPTSTEAAIQITPALAGQSISWSANKKTITIVPSTKLTTNTTYAVTVFDSAKDVDGKRLDGDRDCIEGGNYAFSFSTTPPNLKIAKINPSYFDNITYWVNNGTKTINVQTVDDNGQPLSSTIPPVLNYTTPSGGTQPVTFIGSGSTWTGTINVPTGDGQGTFTAGNNVQVTGITAFTVDTTPPTLVSAHVGSLSCGCSTRSITFQLNPTDSGSGVDVITPIGLGLSSINRTTWSITDDNLASSLIGTSQVLVIPSGALFGRKNSLIFKTELDEFVKQGGTLVVFSQQHGYEFSVIPVPRETDGTYKNISGYGWAEDQSCQYGSAYIETWHQMLAGQSNATPSISVDGYFLSYPSNATVILRRVANGQPALITYPYGKGQVVATTMYSDFDRTIVA